LGTSGANARYGELLPPHGELVAAFPPAGVDDNIAELESRAEGVDDALGLEEEGDVVDRLDVVDGEDLFGGDVAEHGNLARGGLVDGDLTPAGDLRGLSEAYPAY
jgi:hypothetical protein